MSKDRYIGRNGESNFEDDFVEALVNAGWKDGILKNLHVTQKDEFNINKITSLEGNLRKIIFENNKKELNNIPLSDSEFNQIMLKINTANTPVKANLLINGRILSLTRDVDSEDKLNAGKTIYVTIFEQAQIACGNTKYQIARQTIYNTGMYQNDRRGDITLLINGLPVIHIELKARNVLITDACNQIVKYSKENVFTGLMGLVQVFFAINPDDAVYFANFGDYKKYNDVFVFHWAKENSETIKDWKTLINGGKYALLSIPEAHQLIGYYTVADKQKDTLKVMRYYQYFAVKAICAKTKKQKWGNIEPCGGIIWCTTGSGKTMIAFKAGQLIRDLCLADKIIFVVDRIELNNQALDDYNSFSREGELVQETTSSEDLFSKLRSKDSKNSLIITSIQKMNEICSSENKQTKLEETTKKKIVFIVDEAQRSQFGTMHEKMKKTFPTALFFGFTGTPIMKETEEDLHDTRTIFGDYISIYTIANGIKDGNVLGFAPKLVRTYEDKDLREAVALHECKATTKKEIKPGTDKYKIYQKFMRDIPMESEYLDKNGNKQKGIEGYLPSQQYNNPEHRQAVVSDILDNWNILSEGEKGTRFHALLATSSIYEAIEYYRLFKSIDHDLNITTLFDGNIGNNGEASLYKEDAIEEILKDYEKKYNVHFDRKKDPNLKEFKKDIMARLAHKKPYTNINSDKNQIIDILIVVKQLLTGYDSQYINTLYLDDVIETSNLIQAISRTNRVYDKDEKPFGIFRFYRKVYTMKANLDEALRLYCEGDSSGVTISDVDINISIINEMYKNIKKIFDKDKIKNYNRLPKENADRNEFKRLFLILKARLMTIKLQGELAINKISEYEIYWDEKSENGKKIDFNSNTYNILYIRYLDLISHTSTSSKTPKGSFDINTTISEIDLEKINSDYLEKHFRTIIPILVNIDESEENKDFAIEEISEDFGKLTERQQKYARLVLDDIKNGKLKLEEGKAFVDYISEYMYEAIELAIIEIANRYGINKNKLKEIIDAKPNIKTLNDGNRFTLLCNDRDKEKTLEYYGLDSDKIGKSSIEIQKDLKKFILEDIYTI